ncbi:MAG TPA: tetratricopeptide repeat protein [Anaerolineae bacterium]|nr:tetratricopeptide repeat protein [Anaerolineae bacterium]
MAHLAIRLLGPFQVTLDGEPVTHFESDKVRALLAYLVVEAERPHRRERLAGLLWPDLPEQAARTNLRVALANLRRVIGDRNAPTPRLQITRQSIQFCPQEDTWSDVAALTQALSRSSAYVLPARVAEAVELYRGDFLEGFSLPGSAVLEEWALVVRERLARLVLPALRRLTRYYERQGRYRRALRYARRLADLDPWDERGQRQVMYLLALSGQRNAALRRYKTLSRMLAEELGIEPEDETTALYHRLCQGAVDPQCLSIVPPNNLPSNLTPFVGRGAELTAIVGRLHDPACRLLTLLGPGGSGKTRLALEAARLFLSDAPLDLIRHGVYFVRLAPLGSAAAIPSAIARSLDLSFSPGRDEGRQLGDYLRSRQLLLVLDNFEHLLDGANLLAELLRAAPGVRLLVTSRFKLGLRAEQVFPVEGMVLPAGPVSDPLDALAAYDAVALFVEAARRARSGFALTPANVQEVVRLCQLVEGLPLGILLAAAWMDAKTPAQVRAALERDCALLAHRWPDAPARQRSMEAVFDHSWRLLSPRERQVAAGLSVFRGCFSRRAAQEVTGCRPGELANLAHKSLLHRAAAGRYEMHELLRQYAAAQLERDSALACAVRDRHCAYFVDALERWGAELQGARQQTALAEMELEIENARVAWLWAVEQGQVERLLRAIHGLGLFYEWQVRYRQGAEAFGPAIERLSARPDPSAGELHLLARLLAWQSRFTYRFEGEAAGCRLLERSLALLADPRLAGRDVGADQARALWRLGRFLTVGDREEARRCLEQSLTLYRAAGDRWGQANALAALGSVAWNLGRFEEAWQHHRQSLALRREIGDQRGIAQSLISVGETALNLGRLEEALPLVEQGASLRREIGDRRGIADGYRHLGVMHLALGRFEEAASLLDQSLAIYTDLGFRFGLEIAMRGEALLHRGRYADARRDGRRALALCRETGHRRTGGYALFVLGAVALAQEETQQAEALLQESASIYREINQWAEHCRTLAALGYARRALGRRDWADPALLTGLRRAVESRAFLPLVWGLPTLILLLADGGWGEQAAALQSLAQRQPLLAASRWYQDVMGRQLAALPPTALPEAPDLAAAVGAAVEQVSSPQGLPLGAPAHA